LGAIRGGYGNPIKKLESERPVAELVKAAFSEGLRARGIPVDEDAAQNHITGIIKKLDCSQYVRREAHVDIEIMVLDKLGQQRFGRRYTASNVDGSLFSLSVGILASVEDLRSIMEKTLGEVVDQSLDDSTLRAVLRGEKVYTSPQNSGPVSSVSLPVPLSVHTPSPPPPVPQPPTPTMYNDTSSADVQLRNAEREFRAGRMSLEEFRSIKKVLTGD
jgi:hypothetical protein